VVQNINVLKFIKIKFRNTKKITSNIKLRKLDVYLWHTKENYVYFYFKHKEIKYVYTYDKINIK